MKMTLPTDSAARKDVPVFSGVIKYAPAALAGVARISKAGNDKHNPGEPLHHARGKSMDHSDCIVRHAMDVADIEAAIDRREIPVSQFDDEVYRGQCAAILNEVDQLAWRALMWSQELHEKYGGAPLAPGARLPVVPAIRNEVQEFLDSREPTTGNTWVPDPGLPHAAPSRGMSSFAAERLPLDPTRD